MNLPGNDTDTDVWLAGKCVTADLGYVGCVRDVQYLADRKCSGRRECEIGIPDEDFDRTQPCLTELKFYLEANFTCMKGKWVQKNSLFSS